MLLSDLQHLVCPTCQTDLRLHTATRTEAQRYLIQGTLLCDSCQQQYPVERGIPRFVAGLTGYNATWNYKWEVIDRGRALNHAILDRSNPAYELHDIYDRNSYDGRAFERMRHGLALEIGCGVGQYVLKSLLEHAPRKMVGLDLTEGVDTLRAIIVARYPELLERVLLVQGSVFAMPFRRSTFDYVYSLGVLHHTGRTEAAIEAAAAAVKEGGQLNVWVYAAPDYHIDTREPGREALSRWAPLLRLVHERLRSRLWYAALARRSPRDAHKILRVFASDLWYRLTRLPVVGIIPKLIMSPPPHPDRDYREINLFDGYVNTWAENWSESELFPVLRQCNIVLLGISRWRLGFWGVKDSSFYREHTPGPSEQTPIGP